MCGAETTLETPAPVCSNSFCQRGDGQCTTHVACPLQEFARCARRMQPTFVARRCNHIAHHPRCSSLSPRRSILGKSVEAARVRRLRIRHQNTRTRINSSGEFCRTVKQIRRFAQLSRTQTKCATSLLEAGGTGRAMPSSKRYKPGKKFGSVPLWTGPPPVFFCNKPPAH